MTERAPAWPLGSWSLLFLDLGAGCSQVVGWLKLSRLYTYDVPFSVFIFHFNNKFNKTAISYTENHFPLDLGGIYQHLQLLQCEPHAGKNLVCFHPFNKELLSTGH